jgi:hypothetical protein
MTVGHRRLAVRLAACAGVGALLAGCGGNPFATGKVDPTSPIISEVNAAGKTDRPFPKFTDIPELPKDVRPPKAYGVAAAKVEGARDQLERDTAENTWTLNDTLKFQAGAQTAAGPDIAPTAQDAAATEALAKKLRERATPPPLSR